MLRLGVAAALAAAFAIAAPSIATAAGGVDCPPTLITCEIDVEDPGTPSDPPVSDPGGGQGDCVSPVDGDAVDCWHPDWGWFSNALGCYVQLLSPQPGENDQIWQGNYPDGAIYDVTCPDPLGGPGSNGGWVWFDTPPDGFGGDPGRLAQQAVDQMTLEGPAIRTPLDGDEIGTVGIPLWLWTEQGTTTWGPNTATASVPGLSVTATARAKWIDWDLGDGTTMRCEGPGTPHIPGQVESPTCDHVYLASSAGQPGDVYTVMGTTTWEVTWSGGGVSGVLQVTRSSSASVPIGELQVLATN